MLIYASKLRFFAGLFLVSSSLATFFNRLLREDRVQRQETKQVVLKDWMGAKMQPQALLFMAAVCWMVVGVSLVIKGGHILNWSPVWVVGTFLVGGVKAYFILDKIARRNILRLQSLREPVFVGQMFAVRTWIIIAVMIILGRLLRLPGVAPELSGFFSLAVGWGLFIASRLSWKAWFGGRKER